MPSTKITKQKWKDHLFYAKKIYIFGIIIAIGAAALIYTVAGPRKHDENYVDVYLLGYANVDKLEDDAGTLAAAGKLFDEKLFGVDFTNLAYNGLESDDPSMVEVYNVQLYAGDNDIYLQNEQLTKNVIGVGFCVPLENMPGFAEFTYANPDIEILWNPDPSEVEKLDPDDENIVEALEALEKHAYAISISSMKGMLEKQAFSVDGKYAVLSIRSKNPETSVYVLYEMFKLYSPDFKMPDMTEYLAGQEPEA